jgi:hypothetical protein
LTISLLKQINESNCGKHMEGRNRMDSVCWMFFFPKCKHFVEWIIVKQIVERKRNYNVAR